MQYVGPRATSRASTTTPNRTGLNTDATGAGGCCGWRRNKINMKPHTKKHRENLSNALKGRELNNKHKKKISRKALLRNMEKGD